MVLVGPLGAGAVALLASLRHEHGARLRRFAFRSLLFAGLPAYIAMFVSGEWITSKEGLGGEDDPAWFVIGTSRLPTKICNGRGQRSRSALPPRTGLTVNC
jgi:hypothetical protein